MHVFGVEVGTCYSRPLLAAGASEFFFSGDSHGAEVSAPSIN